MIRQISCSLHKTIKVFITNILTIVGFHVNIEIGQLTQESALLQATSTVYLLFSHPNTSTDGLRKIQNCSDHSQASSHVPMLSDYPGTENLPYRTMRTAEAVVPLHLQAFAPARGDRHPIPEASPHCQRSLEITAACPNILLHYVYNRPRYQARRTGTPPPRTYGSPEVPTSMRHTLP